MFHVELRNAFDDSIAEADIDVETITLDDIAQLNWIICADDSIHITED